MASQPPPGAVPPYPPLSQALGQPYDSQPNPTADPSYRPSGKTDASYEYRPPLESSYVPLPPSTTGPPIYPPPQSSGVTFAGPPPSVSSVPSYPPPPMAVVDQIPVPGPSMTPLPLATATKPRLKDTKAATEFALREYMSLQRSRYRKGEAGIEERLRIQASTVLGDLRVLRQDVGNMVKSAESHRWRRFIIGGAIATFIPAVRMLFRRPQHEVDAANDTEYAFKKSRSLISRILSSVHRPGMATLAFFVFAVMYVFQNEVTLRVARTVSKRLKRLSSKVERGEEDINEDDLKLLVGWRWNVLLWS